MGRVRLRALGHRGLLNLQCSCPSRTYSLFERIGSDTTTAFVTRSIDLSFAPAGWRYRQYAEAVAWFGHPKISIDDAIVFCHCCHCLCKQ